MSAEKEFFKAVLADDGPAVERLLASSPQLAQKKGKNHDNLVFFQKTALMAAASQGLTEAARALLPHSNLRSADQTTGKTSLEMAAAGDHVDCLRLLLALEPKIAGAKGGPRERATQAAVERNAMGSLAALLEDGQKDGPAAGRAFALRALMKAASMGREECARVAVQAIAASEKLTLAEGSAAFALAVEWARPEAGVSFLPLWKCADFLAPFAPREEVRAVAQAWPQGLGGAWAWLESEDLSEEVKKAERAAPGAAAIAPAEGATRGKGCAEQAPARPPLRI